MERTPAAVVLARDETTLATALAALAAQSIDASTAADTAQAWDLVHRVQPAIILIDAELPEAAALIERIAGWDSQIQMLLLTGPYSPDTAIAGIRQGARDCLPKPLNPAALNRRLEDMLREARLRQDTLQLDARLLDNFRFHGMVGRCPRMLDTFARIRRIAPHYRVALVSGATGTGKELVANALHSLSPVSTRRFAVCNCSAIVETLFESELFGHVKGAFTGAIQDRVGLFEYAHGGTVFLDEIADMPFSTQSKLLRVVQNRELQRVGSPEVRKVDVRVIAATNRDMRSLVARNLFREDLYYRLTMVELKLPGLADRKEDLPLLQRHILEKLALAYAKPIVGISRRAQTVLARHPWPGNVRELENVLGHAAMMADSNFIDVRDLPDYLQTATSGPVAAPPELMSLADLERRYALHVLQRVGANKLHAARILGISRATLYRILRDTTTESGGGLVDFLEAAAAPGRMRIQ